MLSGLLFSAQSFDEGAPLPMPSVSTQTFVDAMQQRYGRMEKVGRGNIMKFGDSVVLAIGNSKLLDDDRYFFGVQEDFLQGKLRNLQNHVQLYAALICGDEDTVIFLPHALLVELLPDTTKNRINVFHRDGRFQLRATGQQVVDVTQYANAFPVTDVGETGDAPPVEKEIEAVGPVEQQEAEINEHTRIQWMLIRFGRAAGHQVWVPPNDSGKNFNQENFNILTLEDLPNFGFDDIARRVIANIDVLWLRENVIEKAFEIESTTSIYSGLLQMSDLVLSQPNVSIDLHLVAPLRRREIVRRNILRPTFFRLRPKCSYISFEEVSSKYDMVKDILQQHQARIQNLLKSESF